MGFNSGFKGLNTLRVNDFRQTEMHKTEPLMSEHIALKWKWLLKGEKTQIAMY